jgi:hypothetical protein
MAETFALDNFDSLLLDTGDIEGANFDLFHVEYSPAITFLTWVCAPWLLVHFLAQRAPDAAEYRLAAALVGGAIQSDTKIQSELR